MNFLYNFSIKSILILFIYFIISNNLFSNEISIQKKLSLNTKLFLKEFAQKVNLNIFKESKKISSIQVVQNINFSKNFNNFSEEYTKLSNLILNNKNFINSEYYIYENINIISSYSNEIYINGLIKLENNLNSEDINQYEEMGVKINSKFKTILSVKIPINKLIDVLKLNNTKYFETYSSDSPYLQKSRKEAGVDEANQGVFDGLNQIKGLSGENVIIGIIDWGFDYTHPNFWDSSYTYPRIMKAWDQYKKINEYGYIPNYGYGIVYQNKEDMLKVISDTSSEHGIISHGSHTAGIAGGNGFKGAIDFTKGVAHNADLIFVTRESGPIAFADAVDFINKYSDSVNKPFVINMSFGGHNGPHDGISLQNQIIDEVSSNGKIFIGSAGNNGNDNCHLKYDYKEVNGLYNLDTLNTIVGFGNVADYYGQSIIIWGEENKNFIIRLKLINSNGNIEQITKSYKTSENLILDEELVINDKDTIYLKLLTESNNQLNNKPNAMVTIKNKSKNVIGLEILNENQNEPQTIHLWNMIRQNSRLTNWGRGFFNTTGSKLLENFVSGDNTYTVGEPSGVGKRVISIGSFNVSINSTNEIQSNNISAFSSKGPTVDKRVKPDLVASGENVRSSISTQDPNQGSGYTIGVSEFEFNGRTYRYFPYSGTSMSGPMVAGTVALLLELNPNLSTEEIKYILQTSTKQDKFTTIYDRSEPNNTWGSGKLDAKSAVIKTYNLLTSINGYKDNKELTIYPNPFLDEIFIKFKNDKLIKYDNYIIYDIMGKEITSGVLNFDLNTSIINLNNLNKGDYILKLYNLNTNNFYDTFKIIKF